MVNAKLTNGNYIDLKSVIGKNFKSFECEKMDNNSAVYGNLRLNLSDINFDISNEQKTLKFYDDFEDVAYFDLVVSKNETEFKPYIPSSVKEIYEVDEEIINIIIIEDTINVNDEYIVKFDVGIQINTNKNIYIFSKGWFFDEHIYISKNIEFDIVYPIEDVIYDWSDEDDGLENIKVDRKFISMKNYVLN